jgi:P27 family predicted phage terminase small subunit
VPRAEAPDAPDWFDDRHLAMWGRLGRELAGMHLWHSADRDVLVALVRAICRQEDAARDVMARGVLVEGVDGGLVRNPACFVEQSAAESVRRLGREFGLTPSGRADLRGVGMAPPSGRKDPARLLTPPQP